MRLPLSPFALTLLLAPPAAAAVPQELPYERLAARFLADHGHAQASPDTFDLYQFLEEGFLHTRSGLFDLYFPASSARNADDLRDYQRLVLAILNAQDCWVEWLEPVATDARTAHRNHATLVKWVESWDLGRLADALADGSREPFEALGAKKNVLAAAQSFGDYMTVGAPLGYAREDGAREPLVLVPDRTEFTEFLCLGGWMYPDYRHVYWQPSIVDWTNFYIDDVKVLATRFAAPGRSPGDYSSGLTMDYRSQTGLEQQIVQLAANSLFANYYGESVPPSLAGALAVNLVIDLYGECNTRVDGDLRARRTDAREMFVPGGNPDGGILPPNLADSRWRVEQGAGYFVDVLRHAMPKRKDPRVFQLQDDSERRRMEVNGPFLGASAANAKPVPEEFFGDQLEFLRSYRSGFLHWLKERGAGSKSKSAKAFATLLRSLSENEDAARVEALFAEVYGAPLSTGDLEKQELEAQFMKWLSRKR